MRVIENRMLRMDRLLLPGDFKTRMKQPHVLQLSKSIDDNGLINVPTVRESDLKLWCGVDRIAAKWLSKEKICECRLIECTDLEGQLLELDENLQRRHNTQDQIDAMRVKRVKVAKQVIEEREATEKAAEKEVADNLPPEELPPKKARGPGRPRNEALHTAAAAAGVSTSTVRRSQRRAQGKGKTTKQPPSIVTHGLELSDEMNAATADLVRLFAESDRNIRNALSAMTRVQSNKLPLDASILSRIKEELSAVGNRIRSAAPAEACPYCWHHPAILNDCPACGGSGFIRADQVDAVPPELKVYAIEKKMVSVNGKFVKYTDVSAE